MTPTREIFDHLPQLSLRERDRRWALIREWMQKEDVDCLLLVGNDLSFGLGMANCRYISCIGSRHGGFLLFPRQGEPIAFFQPPHMTWPIHPNALAQNWVKDVRFNPGIDGVIKVLKETVSPLKKVGLVSGANVLQRENTPYTIYQGIIEGLAGVEVINASSFFIEMRKIKSEDEIAFLRKAGEIHRKVIQAKIDAVQEGVTEAEVYAAMVAAMIKNGGEAEIFHLLHSGPTEAPALQHLLHGLDPNISPTQRRLRRGDTVISETHITYGGYMTAAEYTVCVGDVHDKYKRLFEIGVECLHAALEKLKPGNAIVEVADAEKAVLKKYNTSWLELGIHSHGLGSPEIPECVYMGMDPETWMVSKEMEEVILQENMVFGTNIDIFDPSFRPDVGIMFGDTVVVKDKPELLVKVPQVLTVK
jgi:Xaa-Pro aminopeptidase